MPHTLWYDGHYSVVTDIVNCGFTGIPMGLTAGFKILDKDRDKFKELEKDNERFDQSSKPWDKGKDDSEDGDLEYISSGWTSMVEDYLCHHGGASSLSASPSTADIGFSIPLIRRRSTRESRKGPYQLLIKERLMGIYMAIYIHRDVRPLVRGMTKSSVTTGLIGGRVGNKGSVGISLNVDGTTFLFLNAHLAAHEGKVNHRVANFMKIKAELSVDDFLSSDDPRKVAEDLTDRFDFTFLLGDLNFRLDISRLHADWLISRQEYAQAFEFDQLHALMKEGKIFSGFHEAPIHFPPTFKYDVLRTLKSSKRSRSSSRGVNNGELPGHLLEIDEREMDETEDEFEDVDRASQASSYVTSRVSQPPVEPWTEDDSYFYAPHPTHDLNRAAGSPTSARPKVKWLSILSPSFITPPDKMHKAKSAYHRAQPPTPISAISSISPSPSVSNHPSELATPRKCSLRPSPLVLVNSIELQNKPHHGAEEEKGVYDSSSKKRVPSWCDRILWKTTIKQELLNREIDNERLPTTSRSRVSSFFSNRFRSPSSQTTKDSNTPAIALSGDRTKVAPEQLGAFPLHHHQNGFGRFSDSLPRRAHTTLSPPPTAPFPSEYPCRRSTAFDTIVSPLSPDRPQSASGSIWRFLPAFLSPSHNQDSAVPSEHSLSLLPQPLKGDVTCLNYNTLDDRGMRRLEGRSDHRPVMGTYVVYV
ncbi:hypothetical protein CPB84DRAFT_1845100 [Gymnopilus junonius]|uniref:Inositol polyphosphate-related phosphatase domain-containing protein n=1 Tax=Gymnopilus junonius TaxID=109634 RepID=A0A9P5NUC0_GYMJU|nr:hypothetical protein CPB84DRAFT_1845100 [Gymnopilus junonius]